MNKGEITAAVFKPISQKQWDRRIDQLAGCLVDKSKITARQIVKNALNEMDEATIRKIEKKVAKPKRPRVRVQDGCMAIVIGGIEVPLI